MSTLGPASPGRHRPDGGLVSSRSHENSRLRGLQATSRPGTDSRRPGSQREAAGILREGPILMGRDKQKRPVQRRNGDPARVLAPQGTRGVSGPTTGPFSGAMVRFAPRRRPRIQKEGDAMGLPRWGFTAPHARRFGLELGLETPPWRVHGPPIRSNGIPFRTWEAMREPVRENRS